ncbi:MAG: hypothetical protein D6797_05455 [Bdellovibrio sp.]|nr:MAG: hypothetical protein D6797_05455 [Bdellovibrio sp.]
MVSQSFIQKVVDNLVLFSTDYLMPVMAITFCIGIILRIYSWYALKREEFFVLQFKKRVDIFLADLPPYKKISFFTTVKHWLLITYYEIFEVKSLLQRRKLDPLMTWSDSVFWTKRGFAWLVKDVLRKVRNLRYEAQQPRLHEISKNSFETNPCFTKVLGKVPTGLINDLLNILPGLFIVGGIFGTFLGIMKGLQSFHGMDLKDIEGSQKIMETFLLKVSFSMSTSIVGIFFSVLMTIFNTVFSAEKVFINTVETFENTLYSLWQRSDSNDIPKDDLEFDENKDPVEALAEKALDQEFEKFKNWDKEKGPERTREKVKKVS